MLKGIAQQMSKSFGANDSVTAVAIKDFEMDVENLKVITFNYETSWVEKIVNTGIFITTDPKKGVKTKKEIIEKSIIK